MALTRLDWQILWNHLRVEIENAKSLEISSARSEILSLMSFLEDEMFARERRNLQAKRDKSRAKRACM